MRLRHLSRLAYVLAGATVIAAGLGCRPDPQVRAEEESKKTTRPRIDEIFVFPDEVRVDDPAVNSILDEAMRCCAQGDYEGFRLLWTAKEEPLTRDEYEHGFKAVRKIKIRALQKVIIADETAPDPTEGETVYVSLAEVELDPDHRASQGKPRRELVLLIRREGGKWRLAHAPKAVRLWLKERITKTDAIVSPQAPASQNVTAD